MTRRVPSNVVSGPFKPISRRQLVRTSAAAGIGLATGARLAGSGSAQDKTEITLATDWTDGARGAVLEKALPEFESQFPEYTVKVEPIGGDYFDKLSVQLAGGTAADVMLFDGIFFLNFAEQGAFANIKPNLEELGVDLSNYTNVPSVFTSGDELYGMPFQLTIATWFANTTQFEEAGVPLPEEGWTWDDMIEAAKALTNADERRYGIRSNNDSMHFWGPLVLSAGGNWLSEDGTKTALGDGNGFDGFKLAIDLIHEHKVAPSPADAAGMQTTQASEPFSAGFVAMSVGNSGNVGRYRIEVADRFVWQPIAQPAYPADGTVRTTFNDQPHVVNANAEDVMGATQLAVFLASEYVQGLIAVDRGSTPVFRNLQESESYLSPPPENMQQINANLALAEEVPFNRPWLEWVRAIEAAADLAFIGEASAEDAFEQAIAAGDAVLAQQG